MTHGTLHVVATPIGNLGDVSPQSREILSHVNLILCEDTRHTRHLCAALGFTARLARCDEHVEEQRIPEVLELLAAGKDVALVSDAGTPLISDPGYALVRAVHRAGFACSPVPGPSALVAALSVSGLPTSSFVFEGFLPRKRGPRRRLIAAIADEPRTVVILESPWRVKDSVADLCEILGEAREVFMGREMTKLHEEALLTTLGDLRERVAGEIHGEIVLVLAPAPRRVAVDGAEPGGEEHGKLDDEVRADVERLVDGGASEKDALRTVGRERGLSRRDIYRIVKIPASGPEAAGRDDDEAGGHGDDE